MTHADFRPKKRSGVVPSGKPRRKIPLLRILLLLAVAVFGYLKFDSVWTGVRDTLHPAALWGRVFGGSHPVADDAPQPAWSADSSEFTLDCPRGLHGCCETAPASGTGICRQAAALLAKAEAHGLVRDLPGDARGRLFARAGVSPTGRGTFDLFALQISAQTTGTHASSSFFTLKHNSAGVWCDGRSHCLTEPGPTAPMGLGRLLRGGENGAGGPGAARWVSGTPTVHPVLPGRITSVDSVEGGLRVRIYHGGELYTTYEPLRAPQGAGAARDTLKDALKPGAAVTLGTVLGEAPWLSAGYTVTLHVRRAGLNLDPAEFFSVQPAAVEAPSDSLSDTTKSL